MKLACWSFLSIVAVMVWGNSLSHATVHNVTNASELQGAINAAVAGDEIVLANGTYSGSFIINTNAGTASSPIRIYAATPFQAILQGSNPCDGTQDGLTIAKSWWILSGLKFKDYGRVISVSADNVEIHNIIIDHFREEGIRIVGAQQVHIHDNVIAFGDGCQGDAPGIFVVGNYGLNRPATYNTVTNNIIIGVTNSGYSLGNVLGSDAIHGYGILIENWADSNIIQGNMVIDGGQGAFRIIAGPTYIPAANNHADHNIIQDNAFLWGNSASTDDCSDTDNRFINNIFHSMYFGTLTTKGSVDSTKGHHTWQHNLFSITDFTRLGAALQSTFDSPCTNPTYKTSNTIKDNLFYSNRATSGLHVLWYVDGQGSSPSSISTAGYNLFWAPGSASSWTIGYTFAASDISNAANPPSFTNPSIGDFSLTASSPGKGAASDGTDIGITYNAYLKKSWLANAFALETQQKSVAGQTSTTFTVDPSHWYQIWFHIPSTSPCTLNPETFTVEGVSHPRSISLLVSDSSEWVQRGGTARWITLGRQKATDGVLNISWTNSACADQFFIRRLPNGDEAYQWIPSGDSLPAPTNLRILGSP